MSRNNADAIAIDVLLTQSDYVWVKLRSSLVKEKLLFLGLVAFTLAFPVIQLLISERYDLNDWLEDTLKFALILLLLLFGVYQATKRSFAGHKSLHERIHYIFDKTGIKSSATSSSSHHTWEVIYRAFETKHDFLLYTGEENMYMVPRRFLAMRKMSRHLKACCITTWAAGQN